MFKAQSTTKKVMRVMLEEQRIMFKARGIATKVSRVRSTAYNVQGTDDHSR